MDFFGSWSLNIIKRAAGILNQVLLKTVEHLNLIYNVMDLKDKQKP